jgi:TolA-binding protein
MDLHLEDLLEREAEDQLDPAERKRLDAHLRHCLACRMERRVRDDFRRVADRSVPDVRTFLANLVLRERARPRYRSRSRLRLGIVAAAMLVLTGLAAAATGWPLLRGTLRRAAGVEPQAPAATSAAQPEHLAASDPSARVSTATPPPPGAAIVPEQAGASSSPVVDVASIATPEAPTRALAPRPSTPAPIAPVEDASTLFEAANAARRRGDHERASSSYRRLIARYSSSVEAHESLAVLGRMLLDDGDATGALRSFERYLTRPGPLAAEALLGEALALQKLGRDDEERRAWTALVDSVPDSVHADRARARLVELGR